MRTTSSIAASSLGASWRSKGLGSSGSSSEEEVPLLLLLAVSSDDIELRDMCIMFFNFRYPAEREPRVNDVRCEGRDARAATQEDLGSSLRRSLLAGTVLGVA